MLYSSHLLFFLMKIQSYKFMKIRMYVSLSTSCLVIMLNSKNLFKKKNGFGLEKVLLILLVYSILLPTQQQLYLVVIKMLCNLDFITLILMDLITFKF